jgi:hypothetical protein
MEQSIFIKWVEKFFPGITIKVVETLNGTDRQPSYLHRQMLTKEYSTDGTWNSLTSDNTNVVADVVAMDSSLPLKSRPAISSASGEIPKMGMELKLNEKQLTALDVLVATGASDAQIVAKLFADTPRVIAGIYEQCEAIFLEGLSSGVAVVDTNNVGTGVRLDYGYKSANKSGTTGAIWSTANLTGVTPLTDIRVLLDIANTAGKSPRFIFMDTVSFNRLKGSDEGKNLYATTIGNFGTTKPIPTSAQFTSAFQDEYGLQIRIVDRSVTYEIDGNKTTVKPWATGQVVLTDSENVGSLVWSTLAEANHPVSGVTYTTADNFILASKYRQNKPSLGEFTSAQARVAPVITGVEGIFVLDTLTVQA